MAREADRDTAQRCSRPATTPAPRAAASRTGCPTCRRATTPYPPEGVDPQTLTWAETVAPGGYTHRRRRPRHPPAARRPHRRRLRARRGLQRARAVGAAQRRRHPEDPVAGLPRRRDTRCSRATDGCWPRSSATPRDTTTRSAAPSTDAWNIAEVRRRRTAGPVARRDASLFTLAGAKHGLSPRDLPPSVSFFQGVRVARGRRASTGWARPAPGATVDLLAELPLIVLVANVPHPLDPRPDYVVGPLRVHAWRERTDAPSDDARSTHHPNGDAPT